MRFRELFFITTIKVSCDRGKLKKRREELGLSQLEVASAAGIAQKTYNHLETGVSSEIDFTLAVKIFKVLRL